MRIAADSALPFLYETFAKEAQLALFDSIPDAQLLKNCQTLLVRSHTRVNRELLKDSSVNLVLSATAGEDHLEIEELEDMGIAHFSAPGANAIAVAQWVISALGPLMGWHFKGRKLGIVGYGNVGSTLAKLAQRLEMKVLASDPILEHEGKNGPWADLETVCKESDIISFHVPLTRSGPHKTYHMINEDLLKLLKHKVLVNAARGGIIDEAALLEQPPLRLILDCWEGEPEINQKLLKKVDLASPHVAGHSARAKGRAMEHLFKAYCQFKKVENFSRNLGGMEREIQWPGSIDNLFESLFGLSELNHALKTGAPFKLLRRNIARPEFEEIQLSGVPADKVELLCQLGFS